MQGVEQFGDFAIQIRMKMMTKPGEQFVIRRRAYAMIKKAFDANGIKFAFPTVQVAGGERGDRRGGAAGARDDPSAAGRGRVVGLRALDQLDLVAVRILDEGDDRAAVLHRARRARDLDALLRQLARRRVDVGHADREVAESRAERVGLGVPVMRQLDDRCSASSP